MKGIYRYFSKENRGFTLVELLIVVIILAVITGIAIPSYLALRNRARESATESEMRNIATALELAESDDGSYPPTGEDMEDLEGELAEFIDSIPYVDAWNNSYVYAQTDSGAGYTLTSTGIDTDDDGDDIVITNGEFTSTGNY